MTGRWLCHLCRPARWRPGTLDAGHYHYLTVHFIDGRPPRGLENAP